MPDGTPDSLAVPTRWRGRRRVIVRDRSMEPFLVPGDRLYVDTLAFERRPPVRGDVVVFRDPEGSGRLLIKRVTGVPGERPEGGRTSVPPDHLFLVGDRRADSHDSRTFGAVPRTFVVGRAHFRYAPAARRGPLDDSTFK